MLQHVIHAQTCAEKKCTASRLLLCITGPTVIFLNALIHLLQPNTIRSVTVNAVLYTVHACTYEPLG